MMSDDDDDETSAMGSTTTPTVAGDSGEGSTGTTGTIDESSTGEVDLTTGVVDEGSSSGGSDTGDESSSSDGSTGDTTGEAAQSVEDLVPGDLVVTEVMANPHCGGDDCEWIEILNTTDSPVDLLDLYIQDSDYNSGNQGRITVELIVGPGEYAVIARGTGNWPYSFDADAVYGPNPGINNGQPDRVVLLNSTEILDETGSFIDGTQGVTFSLSSSMLDAVSNDDSDAWCGGVDPFDANTTTEYGSPGAANPPC